MRSFFHFAFQIPKLGEALRFDRCTFSGQQGRSADTELALALLNTFDAC
jgi:extradiol dioxygenase family protein